MVEGNLTKNEKNIYDMIQSYNEGVGEPLMAETAEFSSARRFGITGKIYQNTIKSLEIKHLIEKVEESGNHYSWKTLKDEKNT